MCRFKYWIFLNLNAHCICTNKCIQTEVLICIYKAAHTHNTHAGANVPCHCFVFILLCFCHRRTPAMIGCSFVANRDYFGELGLLDSGMDVYGGENIELGIRVCVSPSFLLFLLPLYPCRFKWSNGHRSVAPLINEAPLRVLEDQSCVCSSQQGCGNK